MEWSSYNVSNYSICAPPPPNLDEKSILILKSLVNRFANLINIPFSLFFSLFPYMNILLNLGRRRSKSIRYRSCFLTFLKNEALNVGVRCKQKIPCLPLPLSAIVARPASTPLGFVMSLAKANLFYTGTPDSIMALNFISTEAVQYAVIT